MTDLTHVRPDPSNYAEYTAQRASRTQKFIDAKNRILGKDVKRHNLSIKQLEAAGYTFDSRTDALDPPKETS